MEGEVIIDGALPRTESERVSVLLGYAAVEIARADKRFPIETVKRLQEWYNELDDEYHIHLLEEDFEFWNLIEDDVIDLITESLPPGWICELAEHDPGTVLVSEMEEEIYEYADGD